MKNSLIIILSIFTYNIHAEVLIPFQPSNKVKASVSVDITYDKLSKNYTYSYKLTNASGSEQSIDNLAFEIDKTTKVIEASAPKGWSFGRYSYKDVFEFSATEDITKEHVVTLPNGGFEIHSPYYIKPGSSLCCFVFKTNSSPVLGNVYIQGYAPTPQSRGAEEEEPDLSTFGIKSISIEDNSFKTTSKVPKGLVD